MSTVAGERASAPHRVGTIADFAATGRVRFEYDGRELVAFQLADRFVAFENRCPHLGGPACDGKVARRVVAEYVEGAGIIEHFSETEFGVVCPWHGFEFDVRTGVALGNPRYRLRRYQLEAIADEIYVVA